MINHTRSVFSIYVLVQELVELVLADLEMKTGTGVCADTHHTCLEVGCGSGAISLSLLKSLPQVRFVFIVGNRFLASRNGSVCPSVHHFDPGWNIVTTGWITMDFGTHFHVPQRINPADIGDPLTVPLAPPESQTSHFSPSTSDRCIGTTFCIHSPQRMYPNESSVPDLYV